METVFVFIFGTVVGSFLNVCIYRFPKNTSIVTPGSHCPKCGKGILWYDTIPLVSYAVLKGRCRACGAGISFRYFLVELITALLGVELFTAFGTTPRFFACAILGSGLIVATFVDYEIQEIPDQVSLFGSLAGLGLSFAYPMLFGKGSSWHGLSQSLIGAFAGGASIYLMGFFGELVFKKEAMGGGDVKLMAMIGSFLGWKLVLLAFFIAPFFGSIVGVIMKIRHGSETIPYGPYLSLGALVSVFWGERILSLLSYGF